MGDQQPKGPTLDKTTTGFYGQAAGDPKEVSVKQPACHMFECSIYKTNAFANMYRLRRKSELCDVTIKVSGKLFHAHKLVLAAASPYFSAMFTGGMREAQENMIELQNVDADSISLLLDFMYTATLKISEENVQLLLPASDLLQLESVQAACCDFLQHQLDPCNALGILAFADTHSCHKLVKVAEKYVLRHFIEVSMTEEFLALPLDRVKYLISNENLLVNEEAQVYSAVISWIKHDMEKRQLYTPSLLSLIRLPLLSRDFLMFNVEPEDLIKYSAPCKDLLIEAMKYHLLPEMRRYLQTPRTRSRQSTDTFPLIYVLGGQSLFAIHCECEAYDPGTDLWHSIPSMASRRARFGVGVVNDQIYAVGGFDGGTDTTSVEVLNPKVNAWSGSLPMGTKRSGLGVAVLHNLIYCIGGYDGSSCLSSVERCDPLCQQWSSVAPMLYRRRYVAVGVIDEHIIAAGGYDGVAYLSSVEMYDPVSNLWCTKTSMKAVRYNAAGCVAHGYFYVTGGTDSSVIYSSVERYDVATDDWTFVANMCNIRMTHALACCRDKLYAIGGNDGTISLNSVEEYDAKENRWTLKNPMSTRRSHLSAVAANMLKDL